MVFFEVPEGDSFPSFPVSVYLDGKEVGHVRRSSCGFSYLPLEHAVPKITFNTIEEISCFLTESMVGYLSKRTPLESSVDTLLNNALSSVVCHPCDEHDLVVRYDLLPEDLKTMANARAEGSDWWKPQDNYSPEYD